MRSTAGEKQKHKSGRPLAHSRTTPASEPTAADICLSGSVSASHTW